MRLTLVDTTPDFTEHGWISTTSDHVSSAPASLACRATAIARTQASIVTSSQALDSVSPLYSVMACALIRTAVGLDNDCRSS